MIITKDVIVKFSSKSMKYYRSLGYGLNNSMNDDILVLVGDLPRGSHTRICVNCDICGKKKTVEYRDFLKQVREDGFNYCPNCIPRIPGSELNKKLIRKKKKFAEYILENFSEDFLNKIWNHEMNKISPFEISFKSQNKIWLNCENKNYHVYPISPSHFSEGRRCGFCSGDRLHYMDSLGYLFPESVELISDTEKINLFEEFPKTSKILFWKCENGIHDDYPRIVENATRRRFSCPECMRERQESYLQEKVRTYLEFIFKSVLHENECTINPVNPRTGFKLRYDNEIADKRLIIEVHGIQHLIPKFNFNKDNKRLDIELKELQWRDEFKKKHALNMGYKYLAIWYYEDDKNETWKNSINNFIKDII